MSIRYITSGDEFEANCLRGEGRHHLSVLKNLMDFHGIDQQQRSVIYEDGTIIKCLSCFGQDVVDSVAGVPTGLRKGKSLRFMMHTAMSEIIHPENIQVIAMSQT
jgi:hypothetical protein